MLAVKIFLVVLMFVALASSQASEGSAKSGKCLEKIIIHKLELQKNNENQQIAKDIASIVIRKLM